MSKSTRPGSKKPGHALDQSMRESAMFQLMIESTRDHAVFMLDPVGNVVNWNTGAVRIMGYAEHEIIGHHFSRFYPEKTSNSAPRRALEAATQYRTFSSEEWQIRKDGTHFWATVVTELVREPTGKVLGFAEVVRDTTERRMAEEALRQANEKLERRVEERTRELIDLNTELARLADTDPLTGIFNRRGFIPVAKHEMERSRRYRTPFSVLYLDIDNFKMINDTWGHAAGDEALKRVVEQMCAQLRGGDVAARIGGDEFVLLLLETTVDRAVQIAGRLCREISAVSTEDIGSGLALSVSVGVAQWARDETIEALLARTDATLYLAKETGEPSAVVAADVY